MTITTLQLSRIIIYAKLTNKGPYAPNFPYDILYFL